MATYKVIQDIEAEDKILGPLTLRQFIFALIAVFFSYMCFIVLAKGVGFFTILFAPPAMFFGFFALPLGRDQPTEVWALAKIRYFIKPRKRIWNQSGVKELVTITAPKRIERVLTKGYSEIEVNSRLRALADTIDSRGWAVKNVNLNAYPVPGYMPASTERLLDVSSLPQVVPESDIGAADDIMDPASNPIAQQFQSMINQSAQDHRQQLVQQLATPTASPPATQTVDNNYWFMNNASQAAPLQMAPQPAAIDPAAEARLAGELKESRKSGSSPYSNLRTLKPLASKKSAAGAAKTPVKSTPPPMTAPTDPAILSLADNDDLSVATLAREAKRAKGEDDSSQGEVVVSLR